MASPSLSCYALWQTCHVLQCQLVGLFSAAENSILAAYALASAAVRQVASPALPIFTPTTEPFHSILFQLLQSIFSTIQQTNQIQATFHCSRLRWLTTVPVFSWWQVALLWCRYIALASKLAFIVVTIMHMPSGLFATGRRLSACCCRSCVWCCSAAVVVWT
jgi:hypothetical protein